MEDTLFKQVRACETIVANFSKGDLAPGSDMGCEGVRCKDCPGNPAEDTSWCMDKLFNAKAFLAAHMEDITEPTYESPREIFDRLIEGYRELETIVSNKVLNKVSCARRSGTKHTPKEEPELKLCVDCGNTLGDKCAIRYRSPVNGVTTHVSLFPARAHEMYCGASAKHFQPKTPPIEKTHHNCTHRGQTCDDEPCNTCGPEKKNWEGEEYA